MMAVSLRVNRVDIGGKEYYGRMQNYIKLLQIMYGIISQSKTDQI